MIRHFVFTDFLRISEQSLCLKGFEKVRSLFGDVERCDRFLGRESAIAFLGMW
jgi:hypothetical protein